MYPWDGSVTVPVSTLLLRGICPPRGIGGERDNGFSGTPVASSGDENCDETLLPPVEDDRIAGDDDRGAQTRQKCRVGAVRAGVVNYASWSLVGLQTGKAG